MFSSHTTYLGIDPTAGDRPFTYVALDQDRRLLAVSQGDIEEVLAFVAGQRSAIVAVCAPHSPNRGLMDREEVRERLSPPPRPGRWRDFRVVEYQLRQHNIYIPQTAAREVDCPRWMQQGFILFHRLKHLNYRPYPQKEAPRQYLEVYPHACFSVLLDRLPFPKRSLEGRIQRQLILYKYDLDISDPMYMFQEITRHKLLHGILPIEDLYQVEELDAMVAAYTAWKAGMQPDGVTFLGDSSEGRLVIPAPELKRKYQ